MFRDRLRAAVMAALLLLVAVPAASAAAATSLVLPQTTAFAILGASCGGIQEVVYATGFDAVSGYPAGIVQLSTRCGGSGRGGGYKVTTYTASAGVIWDFTGTVVSYVRPAPPTTVNPTLSVTDSHANRLTNASGTATLVLAAGFVPTARIVSVAPVTGPATGGTSVTITGTGFTGATKVLFGTVAATSFTVVSSTSITAVAPATAGGAVDVRIVNAGGTSATLAADQFTFVAAPTVTGVSPNSGSPAGGATATISGTHLAAVTRVTFGGVAAGFTVNSDTSITAWVPGAEAAGVADVRVTSIGGTSARVTADRYTYVVIRPVVTAISPTSGTPDGGTEVTITGSNLTGVGEVDFGGVAASFWVNDATSITAYSPTAAGPGPVNVTVVAYASRSAVSASAVFTYTATPVVTGISPASGTADGGTDVTITGTDLAGATEVDFGGVAATFVVNADGSITATSPAGVSGPVDITVITAAGTSATSAADVFTYVATPVVSGISPATGPIDGGQVILVSGSGLSGTTEVDFAGVAVPFAVIDDTSLLALTPAAAAPGAVDVTVITDGGTSVASAADLYTYVAAPVVTGISPATGTVDGGTDVTITGTDLGGATEVDFGGIAATFVVNADGSITATSPAGAAGPVDITVITDGGTSATSAGDVFTYA